MKLKQNFYTQSDVTQVARDLLGNILMTKIGGVVTGGIIVETEAYSWREKGCHAYLGKKTQRNAVMFDGGGVAYVYLCYGMHHLVNVVTNAPGAAEAVLIRAIEPLIGIDEMIRRRRATAVSSNLTSGPGKLTQALHITRNLNGKSFMGDEIWIERGTRRQHDHDIVAATRIGIDYAGSDAALPWRFYLKDNRWVSYRERL